MYKLLIVTDREDIRQMFETQIDWASLGCRSPRMADTAEAAIELINTKAVDAVGLHLPKAKAAHLVRFLNYGRPSLPVFTVYSSLEKQMNVLKDTRRLLDKMHQDFADEGYDEETMLTIQRDEMIHGMLAGDYTEWDRLRSMLTLTRIRINAEATCVLYEIDMPQGDVFSDHHYHAQRRLERALRNNFFGRYVDGIYYAVAVLTPRHVRLVCIPMMNEAEEDAEAFAARADEHVQDSISRIREYLDLDMEVTESAWLNGLKEFIENVK